MKFCVLLSIYWPSWCVLLLYFIIYFVCIFVMAFFNFSLAFGCVYIQLHFVAARHDKCMNNWTHNEARYHDYEWQIVAGGINDIAPGQTFPRLRMWHFWYLSFHTHLTHISLSHAQHSYNLRDRRLNFVLIEKNSQLNERHFIIRQLYKYCYWSYVYVLLLSCILTISYNSVVTTVIKWTLYCIVLHCIAL